MAQSKKTDTYDCNPEIRTAKQGPFLVGGIARFTPDLMESLVGFAQTFERGQQNVVEHNLFSDAKEGFPPHD